MEVSKEVHPKGTELIQTLVDLTGLPEAFVHQELEDILSTTSAAETTKSELTLDELRAALIEYLEKCQAELDPTDSISPILPI